MPKTRYRQPREREGGGGDVSFRAGGSQSAHGQRGKHSNWGQAMPTERERAILRWLKDRTPVDGDATFYTDQIGTSARLLNSLHRQGLLRRHDPNTNFYTRAGAEPIRWSISHPGRIAAE